MPEPIDWSSVDDDELLALLAEALDRSEPVPDGAHEAALAAFELRDLDAELAGLLADSRTDELAGVRSATVADPVALLFATESLEIAVEVVRHRAVGQVVPAGAAAGRVEAPGWRTALFAIDDLGRFAVDLPPDRPVRLVVHAPSGLVRTDWFRA